MTAKENGKVPQIAPSMPVNPRKQTALRIRGLQRDCANLGKANGRSIWRDGQTDGAKLILDLVMSVVREDGPRRNKAQNVAQ